MNGDGKNKWKGVPELNKKYKGIVSDNIDPLQEGRLQVKVPDLLGDGDCIWAESASPLSGKQMGIYFVPPKGSGVWVEFPCGDSDSPVWTGCWRGSKDDLPPAALSVSPKFPPIIIQSESGNKITISSEPGEGIKLETKEGGPRIVINEEGIEISTGNGASIKLQNSTVSINNGALDIK
jgi:uncharacterized protein involved in type VI secretion and phage assembly